MEEIKQMTLNEKNLSLEEFKKEREKLENKPGVKVIEVKPGIFKSQIRG